MEEMPKITVKDRLKRHAFTGLSISVIGSWFAFDPAFVKELFNEALQHDITRYTIAFIIAWKIVKRDMKRDMKEEFLGLRVEISKLGEGFNKVVQDLQQHSGRLDKLDIIVTQLKELYEKLIPGEKDG